MKRCILGPLAGSSTAADRPSQLSQWHFDCCSNSTYSKSSVVESSRSFSMTGTTTSDSAPLPAALLPAWRQTTSSLPSSMGTMRPHSSLGNYPTHIIAACPQERGRNNWLSSIGAGFTFRRPRALQVAYWRWYVPQADGEGTLYCRARDSSKPAFGIA